MRSSNRILKSLALTDSATAIRSVTNIALQAVLCTRIRPTGTRDYCAGSCDISRLDDPLNRSVPEAI